MRVDETAFAYSCRLDGADHEDDLLNCQMLGMLVAGPTVKRSVVRLF